MRRCGNDLPEVSEERLAAYVACHNAVRFFKSLPVDDIKSVVRWYIDCGKGDFLYEDNAHISLCDSARFRTSFAYATAAVLGPTDVIAGRA